MNNKFIFSVNTKSFSKSVVITDGNENLYTFDCERVYKLIESSIKEVNHLTYDEKHKMLSFMTDASINNTRHNFLELYLGADEKTKDNLFNLIKNNFCEIVSVQLYEFESMLEENNQEQMIRDFLYSGIEQNLFVFFIKNNFKDLKFGKSKAKISFEYIKDIKYPTEDQWELIKKYL